MSAFWIRSKWKKDDLQHKRVELRVPSGRGMARGIGELSVLQNPAGLLSIKVIARIQEQDRKQVAAEIHDHLTQVGVDLLERHPDPKTAEFRLRN